MARRHAVAVASLALGAGHVVVPAWTLFHAGQLGGALGLAPGPAPSLTWAALIAAAGIPMIALGLRSGRAVLGRGAAARIAAAMLLIGGASGSAGVRLWSAVEPELGPRSELAVVPGLLTALCGLGLMIALTLRRERRSGPAASLPTLPELDGAERVYGMLEWLSVRAWAGLVLLCAWRLHGGEAGVPAGFVVPGAADVDTATSAYGVCGLALLLAPKIVLRPSTLFGGLLKAAVLVGLGLFTLPAVELAGSHLAAQADLGAAATMIAPAMKLALSIAVTASIVFAFFRQLAGPVRLDGLGRPIERLRTDDLRALRASRMDG